MRGLFVFLSAAVVIGVVMVAFLNSRENGRRSQAQLEAVETLDCVVSAFAASNGLSGEWVDYCQTETALKIWSQPPGSPLRVGSGDRGSEDTTEGARRLRRNYERQSQILCLAGVKNALRGIGTDPK